jgi:hypothetical protein
MVGPDEGVAMDVKEAVARAKQHVFHLFTEEALSNVGLEEVEFDESRKEWRVTIGFSRPWDKTSGLAVLAMPSGRTHKVLRVSGDTGTVLSVKNREAA